MLHYIYIIRWIILMVASGCLIYNSRFFKEIPEGNRFVIGATAMPLFTALYDYLLGLIWPGAPVGLFRYGILFISVWYIRYHKNYCIIIRLWVKVRNEIREYKSKTIRFDALFFASVGLCAVFLTAIYLIRDRITARLGAFAFLSKVLIIGIAVVLIIIFLFYHLKSKKWMNAFEQAYKACFIICIGIVSVCFCSSAIAGIMDNMPGWDESHYEMQARFFVEDRNSWEIDHYVGDKEGAILPDDHGPLWEIIIADANFFAYDTLNSGMVRLCHSLIGFLSYIALFNYGYIIAGAKGGLLSVFFTLSYRYSMIYMFLGDREGFRFISLYFFVVYMFNYIKSIVYERKRIKKNCEIRKIIIEITEWFIGTLVISYLGMNGHGSNVVIMFGIFIIFTAFAIWRRIGFGEYILTGVATLLGVILCLEKNIRRYFVQGEFTSSTTWAFRGTKAAELTRKVSENRGNWEKIIASYTKEEFLLIGLGVVSIILLFLYCIRHYRNSKERFDLYESVFLNLSISFGMLFPLLGLFDILGYNFSMWLVEQTRYRMYFLIVFAILGATMIKVLYSDSNKVARVVSLVLCATFCIISMRTTVQYTSLPPIFRGNSITEYHIETSDDIINNYHTTGNIFVSDQILGYFFRIPTKLGFTDFNHPILVANNVDEIEAAIDELNIETFVFSYQDDYYHYDVLPFYDYLQKSDKVIRKVYNFDNDYEIKVYKIEPEVWD